MINLLSKNDKTKLNDDNTIDYADLLLQKLELAKESKELVYTQHVRNIGKTYALIEFAKKYNYAVVVKDLRLAISLRKDCNYEAIYSNDIKDISNKRIIGKLIVVDEGIENIDELKLNNCDIVTGYSESNLINNEIGFNQQIIHTLKEEAIVLYRTIKYERENGNYGTYKNLILAYKEIIDMLDRYSQN